MNNYAIEPTRTDAPLVAEDKGLHKNATILAISSGLVKHFIINNNQHGRKTAA